MNSKLQDAQLDSFIKVPWGTTQVGVSIPFGHAVALDWIPGVKHHVLSKPPDILTVSKGTTALLVGWHVFDCDLKLKTVDSVIMEVESADAVSQDCPIPMKFEAGTDIFLEGTAQSAQVHFLVFKDRVRRGRSKR